QLGLLFPGTARPTKQALSEQDGLMRIAFVASAVPRRCGIATFTADLIAAVKAADPNVRVVQAAIDEPNAARAYGPEVRWRIRQGRSEARRVGTERSCRGGAFTDSYVRATNVR